MKLSENGIDPSVEEVPTGSLMVCLVDTAGRRIDAVIIDKLEGGVVFEASGLKDGMQYEVIVGRTEAQIAAELDAIKFATKDAGRREAAREEPIWIRQKQAPRSARKARVR